MKVLVTGANGLLGQKLVKLLNVRQYECIATGIGPDRNLSVGHQYFQLDITNKDAVISLLSDIKPDVVINTAAMTQVDDCEFHKEKCDAINVEAIKHLIEGCQKHNSLLIHLSTDFVFDGENGPYREEDPVNPLSYYALSKVRSEKLLFDSKIDWAIVRTMLVYGVAEDMSRSNIVLWVKSSLENNKSIRVVNDQWRMPTLAEDLAMGCLLVAEKRAKGIFHISGKDMMTPYDIALQTARFFHLKEDLISETDGSAFTQPAKRPGKTGFILDKSIKLLGYNPVSFQTGLEIVAKQLTAK